MVKLGGVSTNTICFCFTRLFVSLEIHRWLFFVRFFCCCLFVCWCVVGQKPLAQTDVEAELVKASIAVRVVRWINSYISHRSFTRRTGETEGATCRSATGERGIITSGSRLSLFVVVVVVVISLTLFVSFRFVRHERNSSRYVNFSNRIESHQRTHTKSNLGSNSKQRSRKEQRRRRAVNISAQNAPVFAFRNRLL